MYDVLDISNWTRKKAFDFFKSFDDPFFNITGNLEVSGLLSYCKSYNYSFSRAAMYCCLKTANESEAFRLRLVDGEVRRFHQVNGSITILREDESFCFSYFDFKRDPVVFMEHMKQEMEHMKNSDIFDPATGRHDLIYFSSIPWISFTHMKHARSFNQAESIPRMVFGKYFKSHDDKMLMPFSVECHHALVDGLHVGKFFENFQKNLDNFFV